MAVISLCFSGNPRMILTYREEWQDYFDMIASKHELRIFFHCWSQTGLVVRLGGRFIEGTYHTGTYDSFDNLIAFLKPAAFRIETPTRSYDEIIPKLGDIYISGIQANPRAILSQSHSIYQADEVRRQHEEAHGPSDVVVRLRFDLRPRTLFMNEMDYILQFPNHRVLFAPSPHWHIHPGGGAGCVECHKFFDRERMHPDYPTRAAAFLRSHPYHSNDICDLYAIGNPAVMQSYSSAFTRIADIYYFVKKQLSDDLAEYLVERVPDDARIIKITNARSGYFHIERSPIFVPEKFIRMGMSDTVIVHGETVFVTERR